jgi:hypothetical protein
VLPRPSVAAADEAGRGLVDRHTTAPHASSSACTADGGRHTAHCCKPYRRPASARTAVEFDYWPLYTPDRGSGRTGTDPYVRFIYIVLAVQLYEYCCLLL